MSEDVKPRKIGIEKTQLRDWTPELNAGEMHLLHCFNPDAYNYSNGMTFIELEPTMRMMDELATSLERINKEEINSMRPGGGYSKSARISYEALEKYRKFKEGLK